MKNNFTTFSIFGFIAGAVILSWLYVPFIEYVITPIFSNAATSDTVTVTASVTTAISCSTDAASTDFGTLTDASVATSATTASTTIACANSSSGCTLSVNDAGNTTNPGLWNSTSSALIESPDAAFNATATLVAGTEGFGIRATTTSAGGGQALSIARRYNTGDTLGLGGSANAVGGLTLSSITIASTTASSSGREITVTHKAAISTLTPGGTYDDTITYSCTAN